MEFLDHPFLFYPKVIGNPTPTAEAWLSYVVVPLIVIGGTWFLLSTQCFIARQIRIYRLASSIYKKELTGYSNLTGFGTQFSNQNPTQVPPNNNLNQPPQL